MIGYLQGRLLKVTPSQVLLDVGGVGYQVHVPLSTYYALQSSPPAPQGVRQNLEPGAETALYIHTHVREDALVLYGFSTELERELFEKLIAVSGIGPRLAQTALSGMSPEEVIAAIAAGDAKRLSSIPGIGKKTAERMLVELRDKVSDLAVEASASAASTSTADGDLVQALISLGYKQAAADRAVAAVTRENPDAEFADLLRMSLKRLSRV